MSLDVSLYEIKKIECECWKIHKIKWDWIRDYNITHNLNKMAEEAGLYYVLRRPEEIWVSMWKEALPLLEKWLKKLIAHPNKYKKLNPENGWWDYEWLVEFVKEYIFQVKENPDCMVSVSR